MMMTRRNPTALAEIVRSSRSLMEHLAKAKTAKLSTLTLSATTISACSFARLFHDPVRTLLDYFAAIPDSSTAQIDVTKENIDWAKSEKRIFLKQNLETRLVSLYVLSLSLYIRLASPVV